MENKGRRIKISVFTKIFSIRNLLIFFIALSVLAIVSGLLLARLYLRSYNLLTSRQLVAVVECSVDKDRALDISLFPGTEQERKQRFYFNADEWVIEGRIVKWKPLLGMFGVNSYYKIERLSGRYIDINNERSRPRQVFALTDQVDRIWLFLYKYQKLIPFIDAVYGNSAFVRFEPGSKYNVYMTTTGFMIKDVTVNTRKSWWFTG